MSKEQTLQDALKRIHVTWSTGRICAMEAMSEVLKIANAEPAADFGGPDTEEVRQFLQAWYGQPTYDGHWPEHFGHAFSGWCAARRVAADAGGRGWISIWDSAPEQGAGVLVTNGTAVTAARWFSTGWAVHRLDDVELEYLPEEWVTHWMPLPDAHSPAAADAVHQDWISVSERLPEGECLAVYVTPNGKQRLIRAKYARQFQIEAEGDDCETEYNEDDDTFYIKAGWLECIDNWGEYSSCYVVEGTVTHWTPLPTLPGANRPAAVGAGVVWCTGGLNCPCPDACHQNGNCLKPADTATAQGAAHQEGGAA